MLCSHILISRPQIALLVDTLLVLVELLVEDRARTLQSLSLEVAHLVNTLLVLVNIACLSIAAIRLLPQSTDLILAGSPTLSIVAWFGLPLYGWADNDVGLSVPQVARLWSSPNLLHGFLLAAHDI